MSRASLVGPTRPSLWISDVAKSDSAVIDVHQRPADEGPWAPSVPALQVEPATPPAAPAVAVPVAVSGPPILSAPALPAAVYLRNRLISADGTLNVAVGIYSDCSGDSPISQNRADLDPCFAGRAYFVGHSPGPFSPLLHMQIGSQITWFDGDGIANRYRVVAQRDFVRNSGTLTLAQPDVAAQFQTCLTMDGELDRILDAVRI